MWCCLPPTWLTYYINYVRLTHWNGLVKASRPDLQNLEDIDWDKYWNPKIYVENNLGKSLDIVLLADGKWFGAIILYSRTAGYTFVGEKP